MEKEKEIIRELSLRVMKISALPENAKKRQDWKDHNDLTGDMRTLLWICPDEDGGWLELVPESVLETTDPDLRRLEWNLRKLIYHHEHFEDDFVIEPVVRFDIPGEYTGYLFASPTQTNAWGIPIVPMGVSKNSYRMVDYLDIDGNLEKLLNHEVDFIPDYVEWERLKEKYESVVAEGFEISFTVPYCALVQSLLIDLVHLRGLEKLMLDLYDNPEMLHQIMDHMSETKVRLLERLEEKVLTYDNRTNIYTGSGGLGYTNGQVKDPSHVKISEMWGFADAQEFTSVSAEMLKEFALPYQARGLTKFGYACYGCCEPMDQKYDVVFEAIPNLRRLSISPWSDIHLAAERLGKKVLYSWKPNPAKICFGFQEDQVIRELEELKTTVQGKCYTEIILKDIRTLNGHPEVLEQYGKLVKKVFGGG